MNSKPISYLVILIFLIVGIVVMGLTQFIPTFNCINPAFLILILFVLINLATAKIFHLKNEIQIFWSIQKIYFLPIGILIGGLIVIAPTLVALLVGLINFNEFKFNSTFTFTSFSITLAIVAWEELWFRGIFLNLCSRSLSAINISITIGLLFMLIHLLNPEISLIKTGPTLFFAGAFLTIVYFYFKSVWLPIGLHFGNNYFIIQNDLDTHWFLGNEGYLGAIILGILFFLFVKLSFKKDGN